MTRTLVPSPHEPELHELIVQVVLDRSHPRGSARAHPGYVLLAPTDERLESLQGRPRRFRWTHELALEDYWRGALASWQDACFPDRNTATLDLVARAAAGERRHVVAVARDELVTIADDLRTQAAAAAPSSTPSPCLPSERGWQEHGASSFAPRWSVCIVGPAPFLRQEAHDLSWSEADELGRRWIRTFASATVVRIRRSPHRDGDESRAEVLEERWAADGSRHVPSDDDGPDPWDDPWRRRWFMDAYVPAPGTDTEIPETKQLALF